MTIELLTVHLTLSIFMFYTINWIGKHSVSLGYITLTAFVRSDDAPAFNLFFRVLSPLVLIVLFASIFYFIGYEKYVENIWAVTLYYCVARVLFILIFERIQLINWIREIFIWLTSIGISWIIYEYFIRFRTSLLPQPEELKNEFWILVILFIYSVFNKIEFNGGATIKRKQKYCVNAYKNNKEEFDSVIKEHSVDTLSESLIYAILLFENFNRPRAIRVLEKIAFPHIANSIGPMQVKTEVRLSDLDSVRQGSSRVVKSYLEAVQNGKEIAARKEIEFNPFTEYNHMKYIQYKVAADYNRDDNYVQGVTEMHDQLIENIYTTFKIKEIRMNWADFYIS